MRRFLWAAGAVCLGFILGLIVAPMVFSVEQDQARQNSPAVSDGATGAVSRLRNAQQDTPSASPSESPTATADDEPEKSRAERADERAGVLDRDIPEEARGEFEVVAGEQEPPDDQADEVMTIRIEVEEGLPIDGEAFAGFAMTTLNDSRSWAADGEISFARTDGDADIRLLLASPEKVDQVCAPLRTLGRYSCASDGRATINALRYAGATEEFLDAGGSHTQYRQYVVNHEVGHVLGHDHQQCPAEGEPAPVMQQQTISLDKCQPNGWPRPDRK